MEAYYKYHPSSQEEADLMEDWFNLEAECDEHNERVFKEMNHEHLTKTKIQGFLSSQRANVKFTKRQIRKLVDEKYVDFARVTQFAPIRS